MGKVERFEVPNLGALNFLLHEALDGGGTLALKADPQGKTYSTALLRMEIEALMMLKYRDDPGPSLRVTLNRPEKRNAIDEGMIAELRAAIEKAAADADIARVVLLAGEGPDFCAGMDLADDGGIG